MNHFTRKVIKYLLKADLVATTQVTVCEALGCSKESMLLRLRADQETTYGDLVDAVRRHRCRQALRGGHKTSEELAFAVGYMNPSSFFRAWRRWNGESFIAYKLRNGIVDGRPKVKKAPKVKKKGVWVRPQMSILTVPWVEEAPKYNKWAR